MLKVWVVTDGRAGIEAQALGLAEAVAALTPSAIMVKRVRWRPWLRRIPTRVLPFARLALDAGSDRPWPMAGEAWPDLWIGNGRAAIPFTISARRRSKGATFTVQLQDPLRATRLFDLVVPPSHDLLTGANVLPTLGALHRVTPDRLAHEALAFPALEDLPHPRVAVLIGGRSKAFDLSPERASALADDLDRALTARGGGSVLATFSRRTPLAAATILRERLAAWPGVVWDGKGANPYFAFLHAADHVVVTADSINMVTEAAATGAPVHIAAVDGRQARKDRFHADLAERGIARPFSGALDAWTYPPLRETERVAAEIMRRLQGHA